MDASEPWNVTLVHDDALLCAASADGTVSMRAVPRVEWDAVLAANEVSGRRQAVADIVRHVVRGDAASTIETETPIHV